MDNDLQKTYLNEHYVFHLIMKYKKWGVPTALRIAEEFVDFYSQYADKNWSKAKWSSHFIRFLSRTSNKVPDDYREWVMLRSHMDW